MATFHENLVQSFTNFKNKYITPLSNSKANKTSVPASITRSGTSFSAKNSDGTEIFTFDQQDSNTWRGIQDNLTSTSTTESLSANQGYIMSRDIPWYGTSSTAASTIAKIATTSDSKFALTTGAKVSIKFTYENTASAPTLNVDSTGAKSIKAYGTTTPTSWWQAGDVVIFTYDGTNWIMGATEGQINNLESELDNLVTTYQATFQMDIGAYGTAYTEITGFVPSGYKAISVQFTANTSAIALQELYIVNGNMVRIRLGNITSSSVTISAGFIWGYAIRENAIV